MVSDEEKMLKERIRYLLHVKKCPLSRLVDTETMRARIGRQINGDASIPFSTLHLILYTFPDVSADWLVRGEGPMTRMGESAPRFYTTNNVHDNHNGGDINIGPEATIDKRINELQHKLDEVTQDRDLLKKLLAAMTGSGTRK